MSADQSGSARAEAQGSTATGSEPASTRFSIVIPAHNAASTVMSCARSALNQTVSDLELVIVDDGSTDDTLELAQSISDGRVRVVTQRSGGVSAARNGGIRAAGGEIVCFLDSDDLLLPRYLETVGGVFTRHSDTDFVFTDAWTFDDATRRVRKHTTAHYQRPPRPAPESALGLFRELVARNFMPVPVAVRRRVLLDNGLFDESMTGSEDWDLWLRLSARGHLGREAPGPLGLRREHGAQSSRDGQRMMQGPVYLFEKLLREQSLLPEDEARVRARLAAARRDLRAFSGEDRKGALKRRLRHGAASAKQRVGLGARWYRHPPAEVTAAFGDLAGLD